MMRNVALHRNNQESELATGGEEAKQERVNARSVETPADCLLAITRLRQARTICSGHSQTFPTAKTGQLSLSSDVC